MTLNPWLDPRKVGPIVAAGEWYWAGACLWMSVVAWPLWLPPLVREALKEREEP